MKKISGLVAIVLVLGIGCATAPLKLGADPILVRAQQSYQTAFNTADLLFTIEHDNTVVIEAKIPGFHKSVNTIKVNAKKYLPKLLEAIDAYKKASTAENANVMTIALAMVESILKDLQDSLTNVQTTLVVPN